MNELSGEGFVIATNYMALLYGRSSGSQENNFFKKVIIFHTLFLHSKERKKGKKKDAIDQQTYL